MWEQCSAWRWANAVKGSPWATESISFLFCTVHAELISGREGLPMYTSQQECDLPLPRCVIQYIWSVKKIAFGPDTPIDCFFAISFLQQATFHLAGLALFTRTLASWHWVVCANNLWWVHLVWNHLLFSSRTVTCYIREDQIGKLPERQGKGICANLEAISNRKVSPVGAYSIYWGTTRTLDCLATHYQHSDTYKTLQIYRISLADDRFVTRLRK